MAEELSKVYEPGAVEGRVSEFWFSRRLFHAAPDDPGRAYTIVIPPPNVTAPLHLGHALNNTLQDVLIRWRRMQGFNTLWMPGTDHAGIATQTVVEKRILAEGGQPRVNWDREVFVERVQAWKDEYEARIIAQLKAMGCSCDWERVRFTMDDVCARAVRETFFRLFADGLIYRGKRLVNWDPATQTVLADDEVEHETVQGHFWYMNYPLVEPVEIPRVEAVPAVSTTGILPVVALGVTKRHGARLPHWTQAGATYAVTFRLADSLPAGVVESWKQEREEIEQVAESQNRQLTLQERKELHRLYSAKVDAILNNGRGGCYLKDERVAGIVQDALTHFHGDHYELIVWAIMPNHVHVVVRPLGDHELPDILHTWKSFTAKQANKILKRDGRFWQDEYYDHLVRDEEDFQHALQYVISNPEHAGLRDWPWVGLQKTMQGQDAPDTHGRDAPATHGQDARATSYVTVATTRPETMLGDTAVAMNPRDPRAAYLVGKKVRLPIVGRIIPIVADEHVVLPDPQSDDEKARFSTGFLKVTPAHDPDDWEIGRRHELPIVNVMAPDGTISDKHGWTDWNEVKNPDVENVIGMDRFEAREAIVEWFRQEGLLEDVREYTHDVGHSYRSHVPIEPYLSDQWYIAVKKPIASLAKRSTGFQPVADNTGKTPVPHELVEGTDVPVNSLAGLALKPLLDGRLRFVPERYAKTYQTWLENLRDWPISRQLWWGHQIPVWSITFSSATYRRPDEAQWEARDRHKAECEKAILSYLRACGLEGKFVQSWSDALVEGKAPLYVCTLDQRGDLALRLLAGILGKPPLRAAKQTHDTLQEEFGKQGLAAAQQVRSLVEYCCRDGDVLDTWFSSALWPFSTMGWPEQTPEMERYYPGDVLCTAREIITLWVSRMVMMGQYCAEGIPFRAVYIHAMIQDGQGRKMSKSLGNGIDPFVAIDSHGADAMRFTLADMTTDTQDIRMPVAEMELPDGRKVNTSPKFDVGRNFCNKLWNASRFAMMNLEGLDPAAFDASRMDVTDHWILSRLARTVDETTQLLEQFKFSEPLSGLYRFFWNDLCDWYLEWVKPRMQRSSTAFQSVKQKDHGQDARATAQNVLAVVLDQVIRLLHPFVPFITEEIYQKLNAVAPIRGLVGLVDLKVADSLVRSAWPSGLESLVDPAAERVVDSIQAPIRAIRDIRNQYNIAPSAKPVASASGPAAACEMLNANAALLCHLAGLDRFHASPDTAKPKTAAAAIVGEVSVFVHDVIDVAAERARLEKKQAEIVAAKAGVEAKLGNENFVNRAKPEVVQQARDRLAELTEQLRAAEGLLAELKVGADDGD